MRTDRYPYRNPEKDPYLPQIPILVTSIKLPNKNPGLYAEG